MTLYVRLRGPQVTLQRRRRECCSTSFSKLRRWGLLPSMPVMFLSLVIVIGFFLITEVKIVQKAQILNKLFSNVGHHEKFLPPNTILTARGDFFRVKPLLNKSAPSVELSAQTTLNKLYSINIKKDIVNYYNWIHCKEVLIKKKISRTSECKKFSLVEKSLRRTNWWSMVRCSPHPVNLAKPRTIPIFQTLKINQMDPKVLGAIQPGGWWEPSDCLPAHSVAVVIPYRNRWKHLTTLLNYLHPLLQKQHLRYKLFVVEQYGNDTFNKGMIMNACAKEVLKEELFHCFIFHDVDMLPENERNMYSCPEMPRHLSIAVNELHYKLPYLELVGGAFAIRTDHFLRVNGYSNLYWGWGGEDDDMGTRVLQSGLRIIRPSIEIGRYTMIKHVKRKQSDTKILKKLWRTSRKRYRLDGLNSLRYELISRKEYPWFTSFLVDIGKPHSSYNISGQIRHLKDFFS